MEDASEAEQKDGPNAEKNKEQMDGFPEVREDEQKGRLAHREADEEDNALIQRPVSFLLWPPSPFSLLDTLPCVHAPFL